MQWALGCLALAFVIFGGCTAVLGVSVLTDPHMDFSFGAMVAIIGGAIALLGVWVFYRAVRVHRAASGSKPPASGK